MSDGPVCHIPPVAPKVDPQPVAIPSIPLAQPNLHSLANTVNTMRQVLHILMGQQGTEGRQGAPNRKPDPNDKKGTWIESGRVMEEVTIYQNNDKTSPNWVKVQRLNQLTMKNKDTGQTWKWDRERS